MRCTLMLVGLATLAGCGSSAEAPIKATPNDPSSQRTPREQRIDSLHALGAAMHRYYEEYNQFPAAATYDRDDAPLQFRQPLLSWRVTLLPFLGHEELFKQFNLDEPWDSEHNKKLVDKMPAVYAAPGGAGQQDSTYYQVLLNASENAGWSGSMLNYPNNLLYLVGRGVFSTLLIVEAAEAVPWTKPADVYYEAGRDGAPKVPPPKLRGMSSTEDGFLACFVDGAVREVKKSLPDQAAYDRHLWSLIRLQASDREGSEAVARASEAIVSATAVAPPSLYGPEPTDAKQQRRKNLRRLWFAMMYHHHVHQSLPMAALFKPGEARNPQSPALLSWRVALLPYLGEQELYREFHLDEPWDSPHNVKLLERIPKVYAAPGAEGGKGSSTFCQVFVSQPNAMSNRGRPVFAVRDSVTLGQLTVQDGLETTLMLVEAGTAVPWTKPEDVVIEDRYPLPKLGGVEPQDPGFFACFADGSVGAFKRSLPDDAAYERVMRALIGRVDGVKENPSLIVSQRKPQTPAQKPFSLKLSGTVREQRIARLRELAIAMYKHQDDYGGPPRRESKRPDFFGSISWRVGILPYLREQALRNRFRPGEPWDSEHNKQVLNRMPAVFAAPGVADVNSSTTFYQVIYSPAHAQGPVALFHDLKGLRLKDFSRADLANTFLIVEAGEPVPWTKAADLVYDHSKPLPKLGGIAPDEDEFLACFADGSVRAVKKPQPGNAEQEAAIRKLILRKGMPDPNAGVPKK